MPVVAAARSLPSTAAPTRAIVYAALAGVGFIAGGLLIALFVLGSGFASDLIGPRPTPPETAVAVLAWALAFIIPGAFVVIGVMRFVDMVELIATRRARPRPASRLADVLGDEHLIATRVRLPDGRVVPELVVGPFGVAVVEELPSPSVSRNRGGRWEMRIVNGSWVPIENPLDRASRDADRVRGWLAHEDHDHVVKVYAAVVDPTGSMPRTATCAVVTPDELGPWLAGLPVQRSLYADRLTRLFALIGASVV